MNQHDQFSEEAERMLDQLVDGELTHEDRRELLIKLDQQTDGWRRCALAFLEAQAWGKEFRSMTALPAKEATVRPEKPKPSWMHGRWFSLLAVAASFLVAFGLGLASRGLNLPHPTEEPQIAQQASPRVERPMPELSATPVEIERSGPQWDKVTVSLDGNHDGVAEAVDLPFVTGEGIDERWLRSQPSPLPPQVVRALERLGHQVDRQRAYLPIDLNDGRRVIVPVDQFEVRYVGERSYQ